MEVLNLNIIPNGVLPVVHVKQYDQGREWRFNLFENANVFTLDGTEVIECDIHKRDGNIVTVAVTNTSDSYIDIETTLQMTACSGDQLGAIKFTKGGDEIASINFMFSCQKSPLEGGITSDSAIHNLQQQIADAVANQYDADSVIFDNTGTAGHGIGYVVTSEGVLTMVNGVIALIPNNLDDLSDVDTSSPALGEALVWDGSKWVNGTVSTVGNLDDLSDVDTTGKASGDSLRYDGNEWVAKPTTIEMTQAEYNAIVDFTPYANTHIVITDAPNLNATANDIEYSSGVTVKQAIDGIVESGSNANGNYIKYADGTMICTKSEAIEILQSQWVAWGSMQNVGGVSVGSWAETFYSTPIVNATISGDSAWLEKITNFTTTSCGTVGFVRPNNPGRTTNFNVQIVAIGRWKA